VTVIQDAKFLKAKVLIVGDVMLDRYWYGPVSRVSPEAPVPVVKVNEVEDRPGGAGNVALNAASLGASVRLLGVIGNDEAGRKLDAKLQAAGVATELHVNHAQPTITKLRVLSRHQQLLRCDFEENWAGFVEREAFESAYIKALAHCDVVILSDYAKGTLYNAPHFIALAKKANKPVLVDPKSQDFSDYRGATLLTPNRQEFEYAVGQCEDEQAIALKARALMKACDFQAMLVTRSEHGMSLIEANEATHIPTQARDVFDVTGAGDTVIATLAVCVAAGLPYVDAMHCANTAAGIVVGRMGAASVSLPELKAALLPDEAALHGIVNEEQLGLAVAKARGKGEKIVFTNGCFDILHEGHVNYLTEARKQGARLIVAVNTDESVSANKGPSRPVNTLSRRMAVLAGLKSVDWVVPFADETPCRLLEQIKPDVLVKGGDYGIEAVVGADIVKAYGGEVKVLGLVEGVSTTATIKKIEGKA